MELAAKIQLSKEERALVNNTGWILTKHTIIKQVYEMFGILNERIKIETAPFNYLLPDNIKCQNGKITKGENYQLLPYVILDNPAVFFKENIFAVRTMFWWGNFFSVTLHLSGKQKEKLFAGDVEDSFSFLQKNNFFICIHESEWQHHFNQDNYIPAIQISLPQFKEITKKSFFKISKKISIAEWDNAIEFLINSYREIMQLLQINYQDDKKDLLPGFPKAGFDL